MNKGSELPHGQNWLMEFKDQATEDAFRTHYVMRSGFLAPLAMLAAGALFYVFFVWDQLVDPRNYVITHALRGLIFAPAAILLAILAALPSTRPRTELWVALLCCLASGLLSATYGILYNGWLYGAVGFVLICLFQGNIFDLRLKYHLFCGGFLLIAMNAGMAAAHFDGDEKTPFRVEFFIVNNLSVASAIILALVGAGYREFGARSNFKLVRELDSVKTRAGDLAYALAHISDRVVAPRTVFVSYRRSDSEAMAGRIRDRLAAHFGGDRVFMDVDNIPFGVDYRNHIRTFIKSADVVLAVIGPNWLGGRADGSRRIDDQKDPIRMEIELAHQECAPIIPVLISDTSMPIERDLPSSLRMLPYLNAAQIDPGRDFHVHVDRLISAISGLSISPRSANRVTSSE